MRRINVGFEYIELDQLQECPSEIQELFEFAKKAMENAYAPYSKFKVGAALRLDNGEIVIGNNQENAAYPSGLCAERVAIFAAKSRFPNAKILNLAIVTNAKKIEKPISPCGSCRQVLLEYEHKQKAVFQIYIQGKDGAIVQINSAGDLLPFNFNSDMLHS